MFRPITLKQKTWLQSTRSVVSAAERLHSRLRRERSRAQCPALTIMFAFLFCYWCVFIFCQKSICMNFRNFFCNIIVNLFSILNMLHNMRPTLRVSRFRPSIFNNPYNDCEFSECLSRHVKSLSVSQKGGFFINLNVFWK